MTDTIFKPGEYSTRNGHRARVYATDGAGERPIHGAVLTVGGWHHAQWTRLGSWMCQELEYPQDLMPHDQVRYTLPQEKKDD